MRQTQILVVDDDEAFLELLRITISAAGFTVVLAKSGIDALAKAESERPSVALVDINLPGISGYEVARTLHEQFGVPTIFLSGHRTEPADRVAGLMLGALDYVVKPLDPGELVARIHAALRGRSHVEAVTHVLERLTPRESEVLQLLVDGLTPAEAAARLVIAPKTVATHVQRILGKLDVNTRSSALAEAVAAGMRPRR